jgi:hypothetical protein
MESESFESTRHGNRGSELERPTVKSVESPECDPKAGQDASKDSEPRDHKTVAGVGVTAIRGRRNTESKKE